MLPVWVKLHFEAIDLLWDFGRAFVKPVEIACRCVWEKLTLLCGSGHLLHHRESIVMRCDLNCFLDTFLTIRLASLLFFVTVIEGFVPRLETLPERFLKILVLAMGKPSETRFSPMHLSVLPSHLRNWSHGSLDVTCGRAVLGAIVEN